MRQEFHVRARTRSKTADFGTLIVMDSGDAERAAVRKFGEIARADLKTSETEEILWDITPGRFVPMPVHAAKGKNERAGKGGKTSKRTD